MGICVNDLDPGTFVEVTALRTLTTGRHNRAMVRKGTTTIGQILDGHGYRQGIVVKSTVPGMGDDSPHDDYVEILRVIDGPGDWVPYRSR